MAADEELDSEFTDALALNARLKELLAGGMEDPATAEEVMRLAQLLQARDAQDMERVDSHAAGPEYDGDIGEHTDEFQHARMRASRDRSGPRASRSRSGHRSSSKTSGAATGKRNFTFNEDSLNKIGRSNLRLMQNLTSINQGRGVMRTRERRVKIRSSAAINRARRGRAIMNDNAAFLKRLQNVKASSSLSRTNMRKDAAKQKKLSRQMRTVGAKPKPKPKPKRRTRRRKATASDLDARASGAGFQF